MSDLEDLICSGYGRALSYISRVVVLAVGVAAGLTAGASDFEGLVRDAKGKPVAGAMVRLQDTARGLSESVYSNAKGEFALTTGLVGELQLRVRAPYLNDHHETLALTEGVNLERTIYMQAMTSAQVISDSLPAVYHFGNISFDEDPESSFSKSIMQRDCTGCHSLGTSFTRWSRSREAWLPTLKRMHGYVGNFDTALIDERARRLSHGFNGRPLKVRPEFPADPVTFAAKVYEYALPDVHFPHDMEVSEIDGLAYTVDRHGDKMIVTDLVTGESVHYPQPPSSRETAEGETGYTGKSHKPGPHSLALGENNLWYTTNATSTEIGVFDAGSRSWKSSYILPDRTAYPHTIRIDEENIVWFTLAASEQVGRLDPADSSIRIIDLPNSGVIGMPAGTSPYGIDIHPGNGEVWYARLFGDRIGYVDPGTMQVTEYDSPVKGPRRLRFDAHGDLWISGYNEGNIARIRTTDMATEVFVIPAFGEGYVAGPYALAIHPDTQEVWVNDTITDRVYRFNPETERFSSYPMPLRGTYTRDFAFTKDGWACTANSPIINAALEGGVAEIICIDAGESVD